MKVSYVEGVANHNGPESCGAAREGGVEALAGGRAGRLRLKKFISFFALGPRVIRWRRSAQMTLATLL